MLNLHLVNKAAKKNNLSILESVFKCSVTCTQWHGLWHGGEQVVSVNKMKLLSCSGGRIDLNLIIMIVCCFEPHPATATCCRNSREQKKKHISTELNIGATLVVSAQECKPVFSQFPCICIWKSVRIPGSEESWQIDVVMLMLSLSWCWTG